MDQIAFHKAHQARKDQVHLFFDQAVKSNAANIFWN